MISGRISLSLLFGISLLGGQYPGDVSAADDWTAPRTEYGHPDLQGYWINDQLGPFERPEELGIQRAYTEEEVAELVAQRVAAQSQRELPIDPDRPPPPVGEIITNIADGNFILELTTRIPRVDGEYRTSVIIDPPNGRLPLTGANDIYADWLEAGLGVFDGPEIRPANERCLNSPGQLPLVVQIPPEDSKTAQIVQTEVYVVINAEYATSLRIIPLSEEADWAEHPITWAQWRGVSVGHWEGERLIVQTRLFRPEHSRPDLPSSAELEVREEFQRTAEDELLYRFTFTDPVALEQPFTGELPLSRMAPGQFVYESACHEGNYSLPGILAGARRQDVDVEARDGAENPGNPEGEQRP